MSENLWELCLRKEKQCELSALVLMLYIWCYACKHRYQSFWLDWCWHFHWTESICIEFHYSQSALTPVSTWPLKMNFISSPFSLSAVSWEKFMCGWVALCKCNRVPWLSTKLELCSTSWNLVLSLLHLEGIINFFTHFILYPMGLPRSKSNIWRCTFIYILPPL